MIWEAFDLLLAWLLALASSGHFLRISFYCFSFPEKRKNPVNYMKWCNVLNIESKDEKTSKPLVCENHFASKDIESNTKLYPGAVPKKSQRWHTLERIVRKKPKPKREAKIHAGSERGKAECRKEIELDFEDLLRDIKAEPVDEITIEELRFEDDLMVRNTSESEDVKFLESLLPDIRRMTAKQKKMFHHEMRQLTRVQVP